MVIYNYSYNTKYGMYLTNLQIKTYPLYSAHSHLPH
jgi:hypothetical protein